MCDGINKSAPPNTIIISGAENRVIACPTLAREPPTDVNPIAVSIKTNVIRLVSALVKLVIIAIGGRNTAELISTIPLKDSTVSTVGRAAALASVAWLSNQAR